MLCKDFSNCGKQGLLSSCGARASPCGGFSCYRAWSLERGLSSCGAWALLHHGTWDLLRSGIKPVFPALAGEFFTTEPQGKPNVHHTGVQKKTETEKMLKS